MYGLSAEVTWCQEINVEAVDVKGIKLSVECQPHKTRPERYMPIRGLKKILK
jgi:hypothetical protein